MDGKNENIKVMMMTEVMTQNISFMLITLITFIIYAMSYFNIPM